MGTRIFIFYIYFFKSNIVKDMSSLNSVYYPTQNVYFGFYSPPMVQNQLTSCISQALSISFQQYSKNKLLQISSQVHPSAPQTNNSPNQIQNIFFKQQSSLNNQPPSPQKNHKKTQIQEESVEKEQSFTIQSQVSEKQPLLIQTCTSKKIEQIENSNLMVVNCPQITLDREEILEKKRKLLERRVQLEHHDNKKRKYHGVGPQKRELKMLS